MADLNTIKEYFAVNGHSPTKRDISGCDSLIRVYGSWNEVLKAAGLPENRKFNHTEEELINSLRRYYNENNRSPRTNDCNSTVYLFDTSTYLRKLNCKTWAQVLRKAGLQEYFEPSTLTSLTDEQLLKLIETILTLGNNTTRKFYDENRGNLPSFTYLQERFGSWNNILNRLEIRKNAGKYPDSELLEVFYEAKEHFGRTPSSNELTEFSSIPARQWTNRFGSYNTFLRGIGEDINALTPDIIKETDEELKQLYIKFSESNGYKNGATTRALNTSADIYKADVFITRFCSLNKLRQACNYKSVINGKDKYNKKDIYQFLRLTYAMFNRIPTIKELQNVQGYIPVSTILRYTNSKGIQQAFEKALSNNIYKIIKIIRQK